MNYLSADKVIHPSNNHLIAIRPTVRPGKKFGFQSAAENLQWRRRPDRLRQNVPDWCSSHWKGVVANSRIQMRMSVCQPSVLWATSSVYVACSSAFSWHNIFVIKLLQSDVFISTDQRIIN